MNSTSNSTISAYWVSSLASSFAPTPSAGSLAAIATDLLSASSPSSTYPTPSNAPFYHLHRERVCSLVSDSVAAVAVPFLIYWAMSGLFMLIDALDLRSLDRYRIHEPDEAKTKNRVGKVQVIRAVLVQQALQTALGLYWLDDDEPTHGPFRDHASAIATYATRLARVVRFLLMSSSSIKPTSPIIADSAHWLYWWGVPMAQFICAAFVLDGWQYGWHRYFHVNKFLYRHVHSIHHRLYVPYAFGALYNHPLEGFVLDSLGALIAEKAVGLSTRQAIFFFALSTAKTVDDHCGYSLPFDPFQRLFANNADYHDLHHQIAGLKYNFSQPYFIHFDRVFGTRMTRDQLEAKKKRRVHPESKVNGPKELDARPSSERNGMALKEE
ncbi:BQ2448_8139 [Microbotryum intermedium]|uniref:BQ2448_8139 protein n=1 Tax=Microbotryum intermedium TaxID=269621 RepID=A0A238FTF0_9BASI|nr:BQ2448_8139 [Microbotryum intermedium]